VGAVVHTVSGGDLNNVIVILKNGRIAAIGSDVTIPGNATIVKASGLHLYPGLIDANTVVGLTEIGSVAGSVDLSEVGKINPNVHVEVSINPDSELIPVTRANGVTHVLTAPQGGIVAGTSALIRLDGWTWEDLTAAAPAAMHVNYPAYPHPGGRRQFGQQPSEEELKKRRDSDLKELKSAFEAARAYRQVKAADSPNFRPDPSLEAMLPLIEGKVPVIVNATEIRQIKEAIGWAKEQGLRMVLAGGSDAWRAAELLKSNGIPVIVGPILSDSFRRDEPYDTAYTVPLKLRDAVLHQHGRRRVRRQQHAQPALSRRHGGGVRAAEGRGAQSHHPLPGADSRRGRSSRFDRGGQEREPDAHRWRPARDSDQGAQGLD
jgi:imidazolonepropionase-like amidohydrolase